MEPLVTQLFDTLDKALAETIVCENYKAQVEISKAKNLIEQILSIFITIGII